MRLAFDVETNGLLRELDCIHCLVTQDLDTGEVFKYDDSGQHESVIPGITSLMDADEIWGHNAIGFDCEAILQCYPFFKDSYTKKILLKNKNIFLNYLLYWFPNPDIL